jgi:hypothetical protein
VEFLATSFALEAGSFVCPSIHKALEPPLSYPTPLKHPGRETSHSGLFVRGCSVVLHTRTLAYTSTRGLSGGSATPHPVALISYPWAQSGSPYRAHSTRFSSSVRISTSIEANPIAATGAVLISLGLVWGSQSGRGGARVAHGLIFVFRTSQLLHSIRIGHT